MSTHSLRELIWAATVSTEARILATVLVLALFAGVSVGGRSLDAWLKQYVDDAVADSVQATVVALATALTAMFLVTVWRAGWLLEQGFAQIDPSRQQVVAIVLSGVIFVAAYLLTRFTKNSIRRLSKERGAITDHQQEVAHHIVQLLIFGLAVLVVLGIWRVDPSQLLLGAGAAGIVIGLAARQTLGAVLAGFVVLFSRPFDLGDWVIIGDEEGIVTDISVFNTQIRTFDEEYVMIPNDIVTDTEVRNRSRKGRLRIETDVGVDYDTDVEHAMDVAAEAMAGTETPMERPGPNVVLAEFGGSSIVLRLRYYIDNPSARKMWKARTEVIAAVNEAFATEGIKIPFPQRELSGRPQGGDLAVSGISSGAVADSETADADGTGDADDRVEREDAAADGAGGDTGDQ
ncbi:MULTISPECIES: mechanosensitive ion channel family protein [Halolamina]|uniref:Mechanosensitive ion channel n=1 Tax=Halolamina pelagica TaxID=699431 RepID=A0A1I5MEY6_9EURY|nr:MULTISPECIES: mechanosensitive ion channel family protein [Halolamina]NHX35995.1 mechanosensitive ion channel family protein [Halolamina sp. R1-12]SFP08154.1 Mechanosensitive ion channel [Halolamina pelagica]